MNLDWLPKEIREMHLEKPPETSPKYCSLCDNRNLLKPLKRFTWRLMDEIGLYHRTVYCPACGKLYDVRWER